MDEKCIYKPENDENIEENSTGILTGENILHETDEAVSALIEKTDEETMLHDNTQEKKQYSKMTMNSVLNAASFLVFVFAAAAVIHYIVFGAKSEFHADCTDTIMWANASHESGHIYDENFKYACFLPFGVNLIMQPLISIFGLSMTAHVLGMTGFFILLTAFMLLMFKEMKFSGRGTLACTGTFLALTLSSVKTREIFWGHTIYYTLGFLFIVIGEFLLFRIINLNHKRKQSDGNSKRTEIRLIFAVCVLCIFAMFTATDGISAVSIFLLPFIAAISVEYFLNSKNKLFCRKSAVIGGLSVVLMIMMVLGIYLNEIWKGGLEANYQEANSTYSSISEWTEHIQRIPIAWIELFGVNDMDGAKLYDFYGIRNLMYIFNAVIIAVLPIAATCFYRKMNDTRTGRALRYMIWIHWAVTAIVLSGYIFGILAAANWRLIPILSTASLLSIMFIYWAVTQYADISRIAAVLAVPIAAAAFFSADDAINMPTHSYKYNYLFGLADYLEEQGLEYGYATFWNSNSLTVISDSRLKVSEVKIDGSEIKKRHYQSSTKWYEDKEKGTKYFLLVSEIEYNELVDNKSSALTQVDEELKTIINDVCFHVLISDENFV